MSRKEKWNELISKGSRIRITQEDGVWYGYWAGSFMYANPDYDLVVQFMIDRFDEEKTNDE